jgi:sec-independent protein translocase protein TatC
LGTRSLLTGRLLRRARRRALVPGQDPALCDELLYGFENEDLHILLAADAYFGFVSMLFLVFGLVPEFPIVLVLPAKVGPVSSQGISRNRKAAFIGIIIAAATLTPGGDLVSPTVMWAVLCGLYELSIVLIRANGR